MHKKCDTMSKKGDNDKLHFEYKCHNNGFVNINRE